MESNSTKAEKITQDFKNELTSLSLTPLTTLIRLICFHSFTFNTPRLLTDLSSSVSQPESFSYTAAAAVSGRDRGSLS